MRRPPLRSAAALIAVLFAGVAVSCDAPNRRDAARSLLGAPSTSDVAPNASEAMNSNQAAEQEDLLRHRR